MFNEIESLQQVQALADVATNEDKLFDDGFVRGVASFIRECATPMTIAIQGGWGAGKTSLISLIDQELQVDAGSDDKPDKVKYCEDIINVANVDIWQQSVANPHANLFEDLVSEVVLKLVGTNRATVKKVSEFASLAFQVVGAVGIGGNDYEDDSPLGSILDWLFGGESDSKSVSGIDFANSEEIAELQAAFVEALEQIAKDNRKSEDSRLVVFVDGLDQINPAAAVDLMEQIKTYLDCPRCVFVLAVDEKMVLEGARAKLGEKVDEERKKMFFDKLVQVPLRIPASAYNLNKFVADLLKDEQTLSGEYAEVIGALVDDPAPRRIKRYINTMHLYRSIFGMLENEGNDSLAMLFAAVILEVESERGFGAVAKCAEGDEAFFDEHIGPEMDSLGVIDGINWPMLPTLWRGEAGGVDAAKRNAFLHWVRMLK